MRLTSLDEYTLESRVRSIAEEGRDALREQGVTVDV